MLPPIHPNIIDQTQHYKKPEERAPDSVFSEEALEKLKERFPKDEAFIEKAGGRMKPQEIEKQILFINANYEEWTKGNRDLVIKKGPGGGARTIEYLAKTGTVVTHFKKKLAEGKGAPLGVGHWSVVKASIINLSKIYEPGMDLADKKPKTEADIPELKHEGEITQEFQSAKNVRRVINITPGGPHQKMGLLLEGMSGGTLAEKRVEEAKKDALFRDLTNGLNEIHSKSYVHRDLHAGNCFLNAQGIAKIGDLGCTIEVGSIDEGRGNFITFSPMRMRSLIYGIPVKINPLDDVWSLGLVLYEMEHHRDPPFIDELPKLLQLIEARDKCREVKDRVDKIQEIQEEICEKFDAYMNAANQFLTGWTPSNKRESLIKKMLQLEPKNRVSSQAACGEAALLPLAQLTPFAAPPVPTVGCAISPESAQSPESAPFPTNPLVSTLRNYLIQLPAMPPVSTLGGYMIPQRSAQSPQCSYHPTDLDLHSRMTQQTVPQLRDLQVRGIDILHWTDDLHATLLHASLSSGRVDVVDFLLAQRVNLKAETLAGQTVLETALSNPKLASFYPEIIIKLINLGAPVKASRIPSLVAYASQDVPDGGKDIMEALINRKDLVLSVLDYILGSKSPELFSRFIGMDRFADYARDPAFQPNLKHYMLSAIQQNAIQELKIMLKRCIELKCVPTEIYHELLLAASASGSHETLILLKGYASAFN